MIPHESTRYHVCRFQVFFITYSHVATSLVQAAEEIIKVNGALVSPIGQDVVHIGGIPKANVLVAQRLQELPGSDDVGASP